MPNKYKPTFEFSPARRRIEAYLSQPHEPAVCIAPAIALATYVCRGGCTQILNYLYTAQRVHIAGWWRSDDRGPWAKVYASGPGVDAPRPVPRRKATL